MDVDWRLDRHGPELGLEIRQAGTPEHGAPGKVSAQNFSKVMCRKVNNSRTRHTRGYDDN